MKKLRILLTIIIVIFINNEYIINLPITKSVLSSILGTTKETLSRKLTLLQDEGLIRMEGQRKIIITDIEGLRDMQ